jgi:hypothetical protein
MFRVRVEFSRKLKISTRARHARGRLVGAKVEINIDLKAS